MAQGGSSDGTRDICAAPDDQTPQEEMDPQAISPRQRLALEAFCNGGTIGDAAKAANVSRQTLHRWRAKYPHFALAMSSWSSACLSMAESQLAELASRAMGGRMRSIREMRIRQGRSCDRLGCCGRISRRRRRVLRENPGTPGRRCRLTVR